MIIDYLEQSDLFAISATSRRHTLHRWLVSIGVRESDIKQNFKGEIILAKPVLDAAMGVEVDISTPPSFELDLSV
ncbi:hypothetical protein [Sedimenticola sp.]|uniref:hypothetical protein n=1 Tax=Sedimenticola sp. TaxID=1940285 RepID=UPI003D153115